MEAFTACVYVSIESLVCHRQHFSPPIYRADTLHGVWRLAFGVQCNRADAPAERLRFKDIQSQLDTHTEARADAERIAELKRQLEKPVREEHEAKSVSKEAAKAEACPTFRACRKFAATFGLKEATWDADYNICFCAEQCASRHPDRDTRGSRPYGFPKGWCGFGLKIDAGDFSRRGTFGWDVAFHGTKKETAVEILKDDWQLLMPGEVTSSGYEIPIGAGHIKRKFSRTNLFTKKLEDFDPVQVYTSPSIRYCAYGEVYVDQTTFQGHKYEVAFQLRQQTGSYNIGQETVGAAKRKIEIDPLFSNNELEYYTKRKGVHKLYRLLIRPV